MTSRDHGSALTTLRWGETVLLKNLATLAGGESNAIVSPSQLIQAHWRWPLSWNLWLMLVPQFDSTETGTFTAEFLMTLGVGQGEMQTQLRYTISPTGGVYLPQNQQMLVPAQDLQLTVRVTGTATVSNPNGQDNLLVGAFIAPQTEPHAMTAMFELTVEGKGPEPVEWMGPGFTPQPLHYRNR